MILSASRRTDIPCYYSEWLMNRLREGYAFTRNPLNPAQVSRVNLSKDVIDCIVFWTKDPEPMMKHLNTLNSMGYPYYFQFTLTPYRNDIERNLRPKPEIEKTFIRLSKQIGRSRVIWRYDPIILSDHLTVDDHKNSFSSMCGRLAPYTDTVTISFVDLYTKVKRAPLRTISEAEMEELAVFIAETAREHELSVSACCESKDLTAFGISKSRCIDPVRIEQIIGCPLKVKKDRNQRSGCGCCESIDIGAYNSCMNGCMYCYANISPKHTQAQCRMHSPQSPLLIGTVAEHETVRERPVESNKVAQTSLLECMSK